MSYSQIRTGIRNIYVEIQVEVVSRQVLTAQTREHVSILCQHCVNTVSLCHKIYPRVSGNFYFKTPSRLGNTSLSFNVVSGCLLLILYNSRRRNNKSPYKVDLLNRPKS